MPPSGISSLSSGLSSGVFIVVSPSLVSRCSS
jgi:hypothetical protein